MSTCGGCGGGNASKPGKASGIVAGVVGVAKSILGIDQADAETIKRRRDKCRQCPHAIMQNGKLTRLSRCERCGCWIELKTRVAGEQCPDDPPRWTADRLTAPAAAGDEA